ncbi:GNAT family N-acetyltransferase [Ferribacterium limneticum]|uniref:GNAT family N-acetyltransferase n=1 Tax=Ferribacterium limneticum TaxID=76259 RepID=UPI001CF86778|nr:GNAT family protein [Ferribacterium limneticum]UCV23018.1 GNAT family N-acetyltransferase [Ferribacterium limneticum]
MNETYNSLGQPIGFPISNWQAATRPLPKVLTGRFSQLEPLDASIHADDLFAAFKLDREGRNWSYLPYGPFDSLGALANWMRASCQGSDPLFFAIINRESGKAVGIASYLRIAPEEGSIEVGHLNFSPLMQRTPMATEAMWLMMKEAFALGFRRYEWKCNALNRPSRLAAQRLGLSFEGVFRQAAVVKGYNRDTAWYATIDREWPALNEAMTRWLAPENFDAHGQQRTSLSQLTHALLVATG